MYSREKSRVYLTESRVYLTESRIYLTESRVYLTESRVYLTESRVYLTESRVYLSESRVYLTESQMSFDACFLCLLQPVMSQGRHGTRVIIFPCDKLTKAGSQILRGTFWISNVLKHCFICHPSQSTQPEDGNEPGTVATLVLAVRRSNFQTTFQGSSTLSYPHPLLARTHPRLGQISSRLGQISSTHSQNSSTLGYISSTTWLYLIHDLARSHPLLARSHPRLGSISPTTCLDLIQIHRQKKNLYK